MLAKLEQARLLVNQCKTTSEAKEVIDVAVVPNENYSVIIFSRAAEMLAEADTIQKAKELKSLALTAADWARRKNLGEKAVQHCRSYALEAERRLGQLLLQTDRAKGGQPHQKSYKSTGNTTLPVEPTLANLGISKRESSTAQALAKLSEREFAALLDGTRIKRPANRKASVSTYRVVELPVRDIEFSEDLQNFKRNSDQKTGVVPGERLSGEYERLGTAPIVVWLRRDGSMVIITGRHRLDLARRMGEKTIPAQIVRERDGFTLADALIFDAESNIRDGHGQVEDYAHYFKHAHNLTEAEAESKGLLSRVKGHAGWNLGKNASDNLYALWQAGKIDERQATAIATSAPGDEQLQTYGAKLALDGEQEEIIGEAMRSAKQALRTLPAAEQEDMLVNTALDQQWRNEGAKVANKRRDIKVRIKVLQVGKVMEIAESEGIDVRNPAAIPQRLLELKEEVARWDNWRSHPDLVAKVRANIPAS
jgi:hypothetical protein